MRKNEGNQIISINRLTACMIVNNSRVERTGIPLSDSEFCELFNALPEEIEVEFEEAPEVSAQGKTLSDVIGAGGAVRKSRGQAPYDEVNALLELNSKGRVVAFRKNNMFQYEGKVMAEDEFELPERVSSTGRAVYQDILKNQGVLGVFGECRKVAIVNRQEKKKSRVNMGKGNLQGYEDASIASFEDVVPIQCESLYSPCKASIKTFMTTKTKQQIEEFFDFMLENYGAQKQDTIIYLCGLFGTLTEDEVNFMLDLTESGDVTAENSKKYLECCSKIFGAFTDSGEPIEIETLDAETAEFDMESLMLKLVDSNETLKKIMDAEIESLSSNKYMKVIMESDGQGKVLANILGQYTPVDMPFMADMGVSGNLMFLYHLLQLINLRISNERVMVTMKRCDVVTFK